MNKCRLLQIPGCVLYPVCHRQACISGFIQGNVAPSIKRGRIYGVERTLQDICSILDTFIFTLNDWASYAKPTKMLSVFGGRGLTA